MSKVEHVSVNLPDKSWYTIHTQDDKGIWWGGGDKYNTPEEAIKVMKTEIKYVNRPHRVIEMKASRRIIATIKPDGKVADKGQHILSDILSV